MISVVIPIVIVLLLVVVNGLFVAAEFALVGSRRSRLQTHADRGSRSARWLLGVFDRAAGKDGYIAIAQLGITLASIGLGMYGEPSVAGWLYGPFEDLGLSENAAHTVGFIIALAAITYLHVVFGEMIPKALALQEPETVSLRVNPIMRLFAIVFRPMVWALNKVAFALMRLLRIPEPDQRHDLYTSAELAIVTDETADTGQIGDMQRNLIHNVFELDERTAQEMMTSRSNMVTFDVNTPADEVTAQVSASGLSRYPVIDGSVDNVVGVLHIKDFIRARQRGGSLALDQLVRPIPTIAASMHGEGVLERFRRERTHAAVVVDEHGATIGLITMDDVIAEIMDDEAHSLDSDSVFHDDGSVTVDGETTLADLEHDYGIVIVNREVATIAGAVLSASAVLPSEGTMVTVQGLDLTVEQMVGRKVTMVRIRPAAGFDQAATR